MMERMTLPADLEAFVNNHRPQGGLSGDATEPASNGYRLTVACACGVVFEQWVEVAIFDQQLRSRFVWLREPDPTPSPPRRCSWHSTCSTTIAAT